jgi:Zn-dependent protease
MLRFRLFGVPFEIGPYFWVGSALLGSNVAHGEHALPLLAIWVACVTVSIVVHELGHALAARRFGVVPQVTLYGLGGLTSMQCRPLNRSQGILVSLAGPVAGLAFWQLALLALNHPSFLPASPWVAAALFFLVYINLNWTLFNLLPILPLDGGQVMRNALGPARLVLTRRIGGVVAALLCVYCLRISQPYLAVFLGLLAFTNFRGPG